MRVAQQAYLKLTKAENNVATAVKATKQIVALPDKSKVKFSDKLKVTSARAAYAKLNAVQKGLVTNLL